MDKIIKLIPIIYPLLLFSGYIDYVSYYRQFHISIVGYLTSTELLLSFLNITAPLLYLLLFICIFLILKLSEVSTGYTNKTTVIVEPEPYVYILGFIKVFKQLREEIKNIKINFISIFFLFVDIIRFFISIAALIFFIVYFFVIVVFLAESRTMGGTVLDFGFIFSIIWFLLLLNMVSAATERLKQPYSTQIFLASAAISFLSLVAIFNKQEASRILQGSSKHQVSLNIGEKIINTDSNFLYVGKTEKYFFFFNKKSSRNEIFPTEGVNKIEISSQE